MGETERILCINGLSRFTQRGAVGIDNCHMHNKATKLQVTLQTKLQYRVR